MAQSIDICENPSDETKKRVLSKFWDVAVQDAGCCGSDFEDYFAYYTSETLNLRLDLDEHWRHQWKYPVRSHRQMIEIVQCLEASADKLLRDEVRQRIRIILSLPGGEDALMNDIINLALRLWVMINFRAPHKIGEGGGRKCLQWDDQTVLGKKIAAVIPRSTVDIPAGHRRLNPNFRVASMVHICGLRLEWTSSLEDHLRLEIDKKALWIFPYRRILEFGDDKKGSTASKPRCTLEALPLPPELLNETNRTLDLLFPFWDDDTKRLLKRMKKTSLLRSRQRALDLNEYPYWKDRILQVYEDVYLAPPQGLSQLWLDRRDSQKFWTFWVALLVLFLTVLSTFATLLQTYVALKVLNQS